MTTTITTLLPFHVKQSTRLVPHKKTILYKVHFLWKNEFLSMRRLQKGFNRESIPQYQRQKVITLTK